jgi:predicted MFS family arabinose efflux permease
MSSYGDVLRKPEMPAVFVAHAVSLLGSVAAEVALSVLIYRRTGSPLLSAMTLACAFVPQALSSVLLSGHVDRFPPRRLLVGCDLVCALLVTCMLVPSAPVALLLLLATGIGLVTPLFGGARAAMLADVLAGETFVAARSLMRVLSQSVLLVGFAVGGLGLALVGPRRLLVLDALSFLASAVLLRWGTSPHPARAAGPRERVTQAAATTLSLLRRPVLRRLLLLAWLPPALLASVDALATPYAGARGKEVGLLLGAAALGTILGEWLGVRLRVASRPRLVLPMSLVTGVALLLYATHPVVVVAAALNLAGGMGGVIGQWVDRSLLDALAEDVRGRLFSLQQGILMAAQGVGIAVAGALAEAFAPYQVLAGAGALSLVTCVLLLRPSSPG